MKGREISTLTNTQQQLADQLYEIGAVKFGQFKLKLHDQFPEAPFSPIYIDLRLLRRFPEAKKSAVDAYEELIKPLEFDLLADIPTAATPLVSSLSDRFGVGMITPRADNKKHGTGAQVDGMIEDDRGKVAVLIDDLVTHADSKLEAAHKLESQGVKVHDIVVLIDRGQGGAEQLKKFGYRLHASLSLDGLLQHYQRTGKINSARVSEIKQRLQDISNFLG